MKLYAKQTTQHSIYSRGGAGNEAQAADGKYTQTASGNRRTSHDYLCNGASARCRYQTVYYQHASLRGKYVEAFPEGNWQGTPITFRHEPVLLDTAGGIKNIEDLIAEDERIIVYNGDIIANMPIELLIRKHFELKTSVTLALRSTGPLLNVSVDKDGFVCDMRHILKNDGVKKCLFAGIYIVEKSFLKRLTTGKIESIVLPLVEMIKENPRSVGGVIIDDGGWYDVGTVAEYEKLSKTDIR